jgi:hypothetical protein
VRIALADIGRRGVDQNSLGRWVLLWTWSSTPRAEKPGEGVRSVTDEVARQVGQTVREAVVSWQRTVCLCLIVLTAGIAVGIGAYLSR